MSQFDRDLHETLRRREPPQGFAGRVLARTREINERDKARSVWKWSWRWMTVAAMVVMLIGGMALYREHRRQVEAEQSKQQLILALRITGSKLQIVQERLSAIQRKTIELPLQQ